MKRSTPAPTGLARRGRRLSDEETGRRMLQAAVAMVHQRGLTVSLEHISLEDLIRDAKVSRSAVYRRWPYKDLFLSDLVRELANDAVPTLADDETERVRQIVAERLDWLGTPERRHDLVVELLRQLSLLDFEAMHASRQFRTYIALLATFTSLADVELRDQVGSAVARSEQRRTARVAEAWRQLTGLLGYRLRPETGATFESLVLLIDGTMRGLILMSLVNPAVAAYRMEGAPFGALGKEEWSLAGTGLASVATALLEPDPAVRWDGERIARVREALSSYRPPEA